MTTTDDLWADDADSTEAYDEATMGVYGTPADPSVDPTSVEEQPLPRRSLRFTQPIGDKWDKYKI